jgi:hypothetical protein
LKKAAPKTSDSKDKITHRLPSAPNGARADVLHCAHYGRVALKVLFPRADIMSTLFRQRSGAASSHSHASAYRGANMKKRTFNWLDLTIPIKRTAFKTSGNWISSAPQNLKMMLVAEKIKPN